MNFFYDTGVIYRRQLRLSLRNPAWIIIGLAQPVLYLALFGPLLKPLAAQIGTQNAYTFFVPGLLIQLGLFGALFAGFNLVSSGAREWSRRSGSHRPIERPCCSGGSCAI
jgi:ABC-2 type transport system permease protein